MKYLSIPCFLLIFIIIGYFNQPTKKKELSTSKHRTLFEDTLLVETIVCLKDSNDTLLKSNKPHGSGWMEAYSNGIVFQYDPKWDKSVGKR